MKTIIKVNPSYPQMAGLAEYLAADGIPPGSEIIYKGRNRIYTFVYEGIETNIKAFRTPGTVKSVIYGAMESKAKRSYDNSLRLLQMGFNVPEP